ncbi:hypothetical protein F7725_006724 [Dissostichus mawsoni]|uniref:RNA methyltransferase n=1 Tax=Dissostichus mawsoni TaxID=36200 RepID=A0A7J5XUS1_DISMA|nr:hypothetical protein F7725_006724 [Dissostichus mawsoni]
MSVDEDTVKTGSPQASSTSALQLSECTGGYSNISVMVEGTAATPDFAAACPVSDTEASTKHTIEQLSSFQQPQQTKLTKRRNTATSSFKHPTSGKRRRRANSESDSVLPTNFLLGGNIFDPLNLNSLLDEEVNRALNAETPKSSPLPAKSRDPVEILIQRHHRSSEPEQRASRQQLFGVPFRIGGRKRHRHRHHGGGGVGGVGAASGIATTESGKSEVKTATSAPLPGMFSHISAPDVSKESNSFSSVPRIHMSSPLTSLPAEGGDDICIFRGLHICLIRGTKPAHEQTQTQAPLWQNGGPCDSFYPPWKVRIWRQKLWNGGSRKSPILPHTKEWGQNQGQEVASTAASQPGEGQQKKKFQYGNYNKYYGYRNPGASEDIR